MTPQDKIKVICPQCGQALWFTPVPGYQSKSMRCPKCNFRAKYSEFAPRTEIDEGGIGGFGAGGRQPGNDTNDETTVIKQPRNPVQTQTAKLMVILTGMVYDLKIGHNVVGRQAKSSTADIKIEGDPYMSRRHVDIEIIRQPNGNLQYRLNEINSKNVVKLNDREIHRNDILLLSPGDVLTLGETKVKLVDSDQTLIL